MDSFLVSIENKPAKLKSGFLQGFTSWSFYFVYIFYQHKTPTKIEFPLNQGSSGPTLDLCLVRLRIQSGALSFEKKKISLEMVKKNICLGGANKQNTSFQKIDPKKCTHAPNV